MTDDIMELHGQINRLNDRKKADDVLKELKWLQKELESLEEFDPEKERIPFKPAIFSRIVEKGIVHPDGQIVYDLKLGISWIATGNEKQVWRLPVKGQEEK